MNGINEETEVKILDDGYNYEPQMDYQNQSNENQQQRIVEEHIYEANDHVNGQNNQHYRNQNDQVNG